MSVHFVGFRGEEYWSAVRVFGKPDFVHLVHDRRMQGDLAEDDVVVFGPNGSSKVSRFSWQDHENW